MKAVVTRVSSARVVIDGEVSGEIAKGFLILLGVKEGDGEEQALKLADKIAKLRIFEDEDGKMNLSLSQVGGAMLVVSQFTLLADPMEKGNRPSFIKAARPETAIPLYELFIKRCHESEC